MEINIHESIIPGVFIWRRASCELVCRASPVRRLIAGSRYIDKVQPGFPGSNIERQRFCWASSFNQGSVYVQLLIAKKILQANLHTQAWKIAESFRVFVVAASETQDFSIFYVSWIF